MNLERDFAKLTEQLKNNKEVSIQIHSKGTLEETVASGLISKGLGYIHQTQAEGTVHFIISELLSNAEQATVKRSLCKAEDTETINQEILEQLKQKKEKILTEWRENQEESEAQITIHYKLTEQEFQITVSNIGQLDALEKRFIDLGMKLGHQSKKLTDITQMSQGNFQGDGHGLALVILALKQGNFEASCLRVDIDNENINFILTIPTNHVSPEKLKLIDAKLVEQIKSLPAFPEQIKQIQVLCESEESDMKQVSDAIQQDPAIAGQIIKLANSGGFGGGNVASVFDAVTVVGLKNISDLLLKVGALKLLTEKYKIGQDFSDHSVRTGFFARSLAQMNNKEKIAEKAYVAGLLHDIGKVVLLASIDESEEFTSLEKSRDRRDQIQIEELALGVSHAIVGALLSHKWNFPEVLKTAIEFHHNPYNSPKEHKDIIYIVYLANCMANYLTNQISFYTIEPDVLEYFNMTTEESFQMTATAIENEYLSQ